MVINSPKTEAELLQRAKSLAGLTIADLCASFAQPIPDNLVNAKGFVGQLLEKALGATAGSKPEPDFQTLGIELKTLPVDKNNKPTESTYICAVPLLNQELMDWHQSPLYKKLAKVLWIPIEANKNQSIAVRHIGNPLLWSPDNQQEKILQTDWQELMSMVNMGKLEQITAQQGQYLQIRPKAANAKSLTWGINQDGEKIRTLPRGFYLRSDFTSQLIKNYYL